MKQCKDCEHFHLLGKGHYRVDKIDWVSPCRGCLQTILNEDYDIRPEDHIHYTPRSGGKANAIEKA